MYLKNNLQEDIRDLQHITTENFLFYPPNFCKFIDQKLADLSFTFLHNRIEKKSIDIPPVSQKTKEQLPDCLKGFENYVSKTVFF